MKKIIILIVLIIVLSGVVYFLWGQYKINSLEEGKEKSCLLGGGKWSYMKDTCGDSCQSKIPGDNGLSPVACGQAFTWNCDCGNNKCWDGENCVDEKKYIEEN